MVFRIIYYLKVIIQYTLLDFMGKAKQAMEEVDLRTQEGKRRYKMIFGKFPRMDRAEPAPERNGGGSPPEEPPARYQTDLDYLLATSNERDRRLFAGYLAKSHGHGGVQKVVAQTRLDARTVAKGTQEITGRVQLPKGRVRRAGGGRPPKLQDPAYAQEMQAIVDQNLAGDPTGQRPNWLRKTLRWIQGKLRREGVDASPSTIRKNLKADFDVSMKKNKKSDSGPRHPDREAQFEYIAATEARFRAEGKPIISIDCKKKELIGNFENKGRAWRKDAYKVSDHDFPSGATGKLIPYGVYNVRDNTGHVYCGTSAETPEFAADVAAAWWEDYGRAAYPGKGELLVKCDAGGANGYRPRMWKVFVQNKLADAHDLVVTVCHYPTGASKYNPIDHRLFNYISMNWAGEPLTSFDKVLEYIRSTKTAAGLTVTAALVTKEYQKGLKASDPDMEALNIEYAKVCPQWNYTIRPHKRVQFPS